MSIEQNKAAIRRLNEAINSGDFSRLSELFDPEYVFHIQPEIRGGEALIRHFEAQRTAFPDYHEKIRHMVAEDDLVAVFYTISGTFMEKFRGLAQTGRSFSYPICVLARFKNGRQTDAWPYYDTLQAYQQLGVEPDFG